MRILPPISLVALRTLVSTVIGAAIGAAIVVALTNTSPGPAPGHPGDRATVDPVGASVGVQGAAFELTNQLANDPAFQIPRVPPIPVAFVADIRETQAPPELWWEELEGLDYRTGAMSDTLAKLNGQVVRVPGFMVPLEDFAEEVTEFLLVPYFGACIHTPPPPPNQMVYVRMDGGRKTKLEWYDPVWVEGPLHIQPIDSPYGAVAFGMVGQRITIYVD